MPFLTVMIVQLCHQQVIQYIQKSHSYYITFTSKSWRVFFFLVAAYTLAQFHRSFTFRSHSLLQNFSAFNSTASKDNVFSDSENTSSSPKGKQHPYIQEKYSTVYESERKWMTTGGNMDWGKEEIRAGTRNKGQVRGKKQSEEWIWKKYGYSNILQRNTRMSNGSKLTILEVARKKGTMVTEQNKQMKNIKREKNEEVWRMTREGEGTT